MTPRSLPFTLLLIFVFIFMFACGDDNDSPTPAASASDPAATNPGADSGADAPSDADTVPPSGQTQATQTPPSTPENPASTPSEIPGGSSAQAPGPDPSEPRPTDDGSPASGEPSDCDAEALAAEALNLQDTPANTDDVLTSETDPATGITTATLDATLGGPAGAATSSWLYLDLLTGTLAPLADTDAIASPSWHIAFKRTALRLNGGQSGPRGVYIHAVDQAFDDVTRMPEVPRGAWATDDFVDGDCALITEGRGTPATAFGIWYDYDFETHTASAPEGVTWLVYSMDTHATWRLSIDALSNNGVYTLRWAPFRRE